MNKRVKLAQATENYLWWMAAYRPRHYRLYMVTMTRKPEGETYERR
ncbi:hypothetical protein LCGC14_1437070 [marine sediment metagenome]|uniref:Uncharacterized protein n=1 Tax=marine sediment metagenome TaxID=412755 RepID=A0A0F9MNT1_9ZZZZ